HRAAGITINTGGPVEVDTHVSMRLGIPPLALHAECVVVECMRDEHEVGFAYGTLPNHPEQGEEAFLVQLRGDGRVIGSIGAFSRPASALARVGGPLARLAQRAIARRYLTAMSG
ncbi:MAG TPA: DUF1990 domain-containing protein, partial [Actinomycetes bacterium]|nr:DUF1990 domain-containing protein [Actinomycetes bacterium]